jgi:hypothetical protein
MTVVVKIDTMFAICTHWGDCDCDYKLTRCVCFLLHCEYNWDYYQARLCWNPHYAFISFALRCDSSNCILTIYTVIMLLKCLFVSLFIAPWATFQVSGGCQNFWWQGCKYRPTCFKLVLTAFSSKSSCTCHTYFNWLIDYLLFFVPLKNFSLIWRRHHCRWRTAKFSPMLVPHGLWAGRDLYRATPAVTQDIGLSCLTLQSPLRLGMR